MYSRTISRISLSIPLHPIPINILSCHSSSMLSSYSNSHSSLILANISALSYIHWMLKESVSHLLLLGTNTHYTLCPPRLLLSIFLALFLNNLFLLAALLIVFACLCLILQYNLLILILSLFFYQVLTFFSSPFLLSTLLHLFSSGPSSLNY